MDPNIQKKLDQLSKLYSKNLPEKINGIESLWKDLQLYWDAVKLQEFHREVHSLCGSSGTYGYSEISKTLRQMDIFLKTILNAEFINDDIQVIITSFLEQLKSVQVKELSAKTPVLGAKSELPTENKYVYILEYDQILKFQLIDSLKQIGFNPYPIQDLITLQMAVKEIPPTAMIIDTDYLEKDDAQLLQEIQKEQLAPIQLFCILPNADILPRLEAIRAGCHAFFQKPVDIYNLVQIFNQKCNFNPVEPYRILIVDDSKSLSEYYSLILNQAGMSARSINNPLELLKELEVYQPDLILMDVYMPECTGYELAAVLRQEPSYTKIPIIFLSTEDDKSKKLFAISLGGDDFLTKPVSQPHLISAVKSRLKRANILNYYMITDSLTGLLNHSSILKQLNIEMAKAKQVNSPLSFVMIDIDHFKKINDNYGHPVGDEVIKKLATFFLTRLRSQDSVGRYGGEEFVLILIGSSLKNAEEIVDDLRVQFSQYCFKADKTDFFVTFSVGISCYDGTGSDKSLIEQADRALYKAKLLGRNRVVTF